MGSLLVLSTWHFLLQIKRPLVMALFAALALLKASSRCAVLLLGDLLLTALAHFTDVIMLGSRLLASQISRRWLSSSGLMSVGTLKAMTL